MEKVASLIKHEVGTIINRNYRDSSYGFITVTEVRMTPDLKIAKIYVSIFGNALVKEKTLAKLESEKGEIRGLLGSHIRLKFTPSLQFYVDDTLDRVEIIDNLIRKIHKNDQ